MSTAKVKFAVGKNADPDRENDVVLEFPGHGDVKVFGPYSVLSTFRKHDTVTVIRDEESPCRTAAGVSVRLEAAPEPALPEPPAPAAPAPPEDQRAIMLSRIHVLTGWWAACFEEAQQQLPAMTEEGQRAVATSIFIQLSQSGMFRR